MYIFIVSPDGLGNAVIELPLLEAFRFSMLNQGALDWPGIAYAALWAVAVFGFGVLNFARMERRFADVL